MAHRRPTLVSRMVHVLCGAVSTLAICGVLGGAAPRRWSAHSDGAAQSFGDARRDRRQPSGAAGSGSGHASASMLGDTMASVVATLGAGRDWIETNGGGDGGDTMASAGGSHGVDTMASAYESHGGFASPCVKLRRGVGLDVGDVAIGILTSDRFVKTRAHSQRITWLTGVRDVVWYSDAPHRTLQPTVPMRPPPGEELVGGGAWKNFPALLDLHARYPNKKWTFFCDDDTFVFVSNLLATLGKHNPNRDWYIGLYWTPRVDMEWKEVHIAYASGGAGFALSRSMMRRLAPVMSACQTNFTRWAGDIRVGKCAYDVGVKVTPGVGFHHERHDFYSWDASGGSYPYGHLSGIASASLASPVTFHHLTPDYLTAYHSMQFALEPAAPPAEGVGTTGGERWRYDFAPLMFKEFGGFSTELHQHVRVLFGSSVEVAQSAAATPAPSGPARWRKDFADPLYIRKLAPSEAAEDLGRGPAASFSMVIAKVPNVFDGDGCDAKLADSWRAPLRKAADVRLTCEPCVPALGSVAPKLGMLCGVWKADACTLRLLVSVACPTRERHSAPMLDVGTRPGASDLVHMGRAECSGAGAFAALRKGKADSAAALPADLPAALYFSLTHGELEMLPARALGAPAGCTVRLGGNAAAVHGGTLRRANTANQALPPLTVACECEPPSRAALLAEPDFAEPSASGARAEPTADVGGGPLANLTITIALADFDSPSVTLLTACTPRRGRRGNHKLLASPERRRRLAL